MCFLKCNLGISKITAVMLYSFILVYASCTDYFLTYMSAFLFQRHDNDPCKSPVKRGIL